MYTLHEARILCNYCLYADKDMRNIGLNLEVDVLKTMTKNYLYIIIITKNIFNVHYKVLHGATSDGNKSIRQQYVNVACIISK